MAGTDHMQELLAQLLAGMGESSASAPPPVGEEESSESQSSQSEESPFGGIDLETILKMGELFSTLSKDDKNTQLLMALRPHLRGENQRKLDQATKLLKLMSMLPLLRQMGIMGDFI